MFPGVGAVLDDAKWMLPFIDIDVSHEDLDAAAASQFFDAAKVVPVPVIGTMGVVEVVDPWALDDNATALALILGRESATNEVLTTANLIGASPGLTLLGGGGAGHLMTSSAALLRPAGYRPRATFTASGGTGPQVQEATAGRVIARTFFIGCPTSFAQAL